MPKYIKKPVVIEAIELTEHNVFQVLDFIGEKPDLSHQIANDKFQDYKQIVKEKGMKIFTLEGTMVASVGDFIIKGVNGEFYPCKPDIFEKTYEKVDY